MHCVVVIYTYIYMRTYVNMHMYIYIYICICACLCICQCVWLHVYKDLCINMFVCMSNAQMIAKRNVEYISLIVWPSVNLVKNVYTSRCVRVILGQGGAC